MPRKATGTIVERRNAAGGLNRTLRFHAYGKRRTVPLGVVARDEAERQLDYVLADVARGTWQPVGDAPAASVAVDVPTFHDYADQWWLLRQGQLAPKTQTDYKWRLEVHLIPAFGEMRLDAITYDNVERYMAGKIGDGLAPRTVNMTLVLLGAILETAVERDLIGRNPAKGRGRRVREPKTRRSYLSTAAQIEALLAAAGELDTEATRGRSHLAKRAVIATMIYGGLRIGEVCSLRWRDVDLQGHWLSVHGTKTAEADRRIRLRGALLGELQTLRDRGPVDHLAYVFPTRSGRRQYECKVRDNMLKSAVKRANANLAAKDLPPLPENLTPHSLRRTFATVLYAIGEPPPVVMAEMGHTSPNLALRVYAQVMRLTDDDRRELAALVDGEKAHKGANGEVVPIERARGRAA
jgi:integrase